MLFCPAISLAYAANSGFPMHLRSLPDELVLLVARHLGCVVSILRWGATDLGMRCLMRDDALWKFLAFAEYGAEFWRRAERRPVERALPPGTWREEMLRLERFRSMAEHIEGKRMQPWRFFLMWDAVDCARRPAAARRSQHFVLVRERVP
jgi:hypothetical protein